MSDTEGKPPVLTNMGLAAGRMEPGAGFTLRTSKVKARSISTSNGWF